MNKVARFANRITFPVALVSDAAKEAGMDAASALSRARRELTLPASIRRSAREIHADVSMKMTTATSLAKMVS